MQLANNEALDLIKDARVAAETRNAPAVVPPGELEEDAQQVAREWADLSHIV
jgi:hypothetical protein